MQGSSQEAVVPLSAHGLDPEGLVHWNLGWEDLHSAAIDLGEARMTSQGVLLATTGERTGRSPNDRFIVDEPGLAEEVWWGDVNIGIDENTFIIVRERAIDYLNIL